jgi:hypothetical protein
MSTVGRAGRAVDLVADPVVHRDDSMTAANRLRFA